MNRTVPLSVLMTVAVMTAAAVAAPSVPMSSVLVHYPFGDASGNYFVDAGPYGNHATFYRPQVISEMPPLDASQVTSFGQHGSALALGTRNIQVDLEMVPHEVFIDVPTATNLPGTGDSFAVAFWLNVDSWTNGYGILASYHRNGLQWSIGLDSAVDALLVWSSDGDSVTGTDVARIDTSYLSPGGWAHFLVQFQGSLGITAQYVDTYAVADAGGTNYFWGSTTEGFLIGGRDRTDRDLSGLEGVVDDFAIISGVVDQGLGAEVAQIANQGVSAYAADHPGAVLGHWSMDETAGTVAQDSTANANHGTICGFDPVAGGPAPRGVAAAVVPGVHGDASRFRSGWSEHAPLESPSHLPVPGDDFTVTFWAKCPDWVNDDAILVSENLGGLGFAIGLHNNSNGLIVTSNFGASPKKGITLPSLPVNEWAHFAVVFDDAAGVQAIYLNGDLIPFDITNGWNLGDSGVVTMAARSVSGKKGYYFEGALDDYAVILGALTEEQIEQIMASGVSSLIGSSVPGDTNNDGKVDATDAAMLASHWLERNLTGGAQVGDFNNDGTVDDLDASILAANWQYTAASAAVPEPSMAVMLIAALMTCWLRLRKR